MNHIPQGKIRQKMTDLTKPILLEDSDEEREEPIYVDPQYYFDFSQTASHPTNMRVLERVVEVICSAHRVSVTVILEYSR